MKYLDYRIKKLIVKALQEILLAQIQTKKTKLERKKNVPDMAGKYKYLKKDL